MHIISDGNHELACIVYFVNTHNGALLRKDELPLATRTMSAVEVTTRGPFSAWAPDLVHFTIYACGTFC